MANKKDAAQVKPTMKHPISNLPLRKQIKDELVRQIVMGQYAPGERLIELRIAEQFGTSQAPVREALRDLEVTGLVEHAPRRGTYVALEIPESLRDIYAVRGSLEETAVRSAINKYKGNTGILQAEINAMVSAAKADDIAGLCEHSVAFHQLIVEAANNKLLLKTWLSLQIDTQTTITLMAEGVDFLDVARSHQPIADAIEQGDTELACRLSREHQEHYEELPLPDFVSTLGSVAS